MVVSIHNKLINTAAREVLKPINMVRKGQSRLWLDDNGWGGAIAEFQPSQWSKGSYLNVAVSWQWYPRADYAYDLANRESAFVEFENEESFMLQARSLAEQAKQRVLYYRDELSNPQRAKQFVLANTAGGSQHIWAGLNKGMICLHARDFALARHFFAEALACKDDRAWAIQVKTFIQQLMSLTPAEQLMFVKRTVAQSRQLKKRPAIEIAFGDEPK